MTTRTARSVTQIDADLAPLLEQRHALAARIEPLQAERDLAERRRVDAGELTGPELVLLARGNGKAAARAHKYIDDTVKAAHPMLYSWGVYSDYATDKSLVTWFAPTAIFKKDSTDEEVDAFVKAVLGLFAEFQPTAHDFGGGPESHQIDMLTDVDEDSMISPRIYADLATGDAELRETGHSSFGQPDAEGTLAEVVRVARTCYPYGSGH